MAQVLIIEPDIRTAELYGGALQLRGHQVAAATTAQSAILAADTAKPDIVILELQLTSHGGIEFLYEFRSYADWQHVPVIVVSTVPPAEFQASGRLLYERLGIAAYHYKPRTDLRTLLRSVDDVLATHAPGIDVRGRALSVPGSGVLESGALAAAETVVATP